MRTPFKGQEKARSEQCRFRRVLNSASKNQGCLGGGHPGPRVRKKQTSLGGKKEKRERGERRETSTARVIFGELPPRNWGGKSRAKGTGNRNGRGKYGTVKRGGRKQ